ncbi:protein of unknown function (plasmid) [Cupriavidus taiwanensis]|uniref:Uncharacterized protein n=1 Tax=Cupriavidus taiwanensis TaxID=164546 RepID=A0A375IUH2_9BURK|nr:protein of unknown function [Cupriavidus taiwanensis]
MPFTENVRLQRMLRSFLGRHLQSKPIKAYDFCFSSDKHTKRWIYSEFFVRDISSGRLNSAHKRTLDNPPIGMVRWNTASLLEWVVTSSVAKR